MIETGIALLSAHLLADFIFQTDAMVANKGKLSVLVLHIAIVVATAAVLTGSAAWGPLAVLAGTHFALDLYKQMSDTRRRKHAAGDQDSLPANKGTLSAFIADQIGHLIVIYALAASFPQMFAQGFWGSDGAGGYAFLPGLDRHIYLSGLVLLAGLVATVQTGRFVVGKLVDLLAYRPDVDDDSLPGAGMMIGLLERSFLFVLVLADQPAAIGFLVAAKSVLRFDTAKNNKKQGASEYIIIGTLASYGWAVVIAFLTKAALELV